MKSLLLICLLGCAFLAHGQGLENPIYDADGKIVTEDMSYEQIMDFSDDEWDDVEHGLKTPEAADAEFTAITGFNVLDWLVANGEIILAQDEGMIDDSSAESMASADETPVLFQTGFLSNN